MKNMLRVRYTLLTVSFGLLAVLQAHGQMKIGNHPTQIMKGSILELESPNQALRITRVYDTSNVEDVIKSDNNYAGAVDSANGMIVFQTRDSSLYLRSGGHWRKLISSGEVESSFWNLKGNTGTDSAKTFLGTIDPVGLRIGTHGQPAIIIDRNGAIQIVDSLNVGGNALFDKDAYISDSLHVAGSADFGSSVNITDSLLVGSALHVKDSVTLETVRDALGTDTSVLVISPEGIVRKMSLNAIGIRKIVGLTGPDIHMKVLTAKSDSTDFRIDSTSEENTIIFNLPYASGADGHVKNGLVSDSTQSFAGTKSFRDSIAVGKNTDPNSTLEVNGNISTAIKVIGTGGSTTYNMSTPDNAKYRTIVFNVNQISAGVTVTLPDAGEIDGRIYTFKKIGLADKNQIDLPVKINTSGAQTIDNDGTTFVIYNNFTSVTLQAQGGNWYIVR